jgi:threonine/homoserine/homoserine lactone efflux protein
VGQAFGQVLPLAVGVALSPVPIIAVILMLVTRRARVNGPAFALGWLLGLGIVGTVVMVLAGPADPSSDGQPSTWVSLLQLALGALLVLGAAAQWRKRPHGDAEPAPPKWMGAVEGFDGVKALGAGVVLSAANPKNLLLAVAAAAAIAGAGLEAGEEAVVYAGFALVGCVGVAVPVVLFFALGDRAGPLLERLKGWMAHNNAVIMSVLLLIIGVKLVGDAIAGLS